MNLLVNIDVDDLERGIRFYTTAFALNVTRRFDADGAELCGGSSRIYLLLKPAGSTVTPTSSQRRNYERHWTPVHFDIVVEDIDSAVARATEAGAILEKPIRTNTWGRIALMADPFGHGFCFVQFLGRGYDEISIPATE
ncbi:MAG TPA: VOC family protein [Rhodocyclaceae bacterium]|nr:VOC family protein [Rhodocyclaceae bacterium]HRQ47055.1 VOC family protein [Rhodocyclaceae bacterium]